MYADIVAAIQGTKTAIDLVKATNGIANYSELLGAVTAVQIKLTDAVAAALASQEKQAALAERVRELEKQVAEVEEWRDQMSRYSLFEFPTGALAHALKVGLEAGQPMHYLCTSCVDKKQISTLQPQGRFLFCTVCKTNMATKIAPPLNLGRRGSSWMSA